MANRAHTNVVWSNVGGTIGWATPGTTTPDLVGAAQTVPGLIASDPDDVGGARTAAYDVTLTSGANPIQGVLKIQWTNGIPGGPGAAASQGAAGSAGTGVNWYDSGVSQAVNQIANTVGAFGLYTSPLGIIPYRYTRLVWVYGSGGAGSTLTAVKMLKGIV